MKQTTNNEEGFTLIEVIVSIAVIITTLVGLIGLISFSVSGLGPAKSRIIAANLAQEGVEIVRNIRDSNWMLYRAEMENGESWRWTTGLSPGTYRVQFNSSSLISITGDGPFLRRDNNGFYRYNGTWPNTPFTRKITIENVSADEIKVISEVKWSEKRRSNVISIENHLYNWFKTP